MYIFACQVAFAFNLGEVCALSGALKMVTIVFFNCKQWIVHNLK